MILLMIDSFLMSFVSPDMACDEIRGISEKLFVATAKEMLRLYRHHLQATQDQHMRRPIEDMWLLVAAKAQQCTSIMRCTASLIQEGESISRETHHPTTSESFETVRADTLPALDTETVVTPVKASEPDSDAEGANADTKAEAWKEGDLVEGLCHLSDGSSRYFAGKLVAVASKQRKVSIRYNDGEEQHDKPMDEIRVPKAIMIKAYGTEKKGSTDL